MLVHVLRKSSMYSSRATPVKLTVFVVNTTYTRLNDLREDLQYLHTVSFYDIVNHISVEVAILIEI